jgi:hypothetical protein
MRRRSIVLLLVLVALAVVTVVATAGDNDGRLWSWLASLHGTGRN